MRINRVGATMFDLNNQILQLRTEEAHEELTRLAELGYTDIILTFPVLADGKYEIDEMIAKFNMFKVSFKKLNLYLGNEIHYHYSIIHRIENKDVLTLNQSNYILIKLPFDKKPKMFRDMVNALKDYKIILSNVDQCKYFGFKELVELKKNGLKFLVNVANMKGKGKKLLKHEMIDYLVTYDNIKVLNEKNKMDLNISYYKKLYLDNYEDIVSLGL